VNIILVNLTFPNLSNRDVGEQRVVGKSGMMVSADELRCRLVIHWVFPRVAQACVVNGRLRGEGSKAEGTLVTMLR